MKCKSTNQIQMQIPQLFGFAYYKYRTLNTDTYKLYHYSAKYWLCAHYTSTIPYRCKVSGGNTREMGNLCKQQVRIEQISA